MTSRKGMDANPDLLISLECALGSILAMVFLVGICHSYERTLCPDKYIVSGSSAESLPTTKGHDRRFDIGYVHFLHDFCFGCWLSISPHNKRDASPLFGESYVGGDRRPYCNI